MHIAVMQYFESDLGPSYELAIAGDLMAEDFFSGVKQVETETGNYRIPAPAFCLEALYG